MILHTITGKEILINAGDIKKVYRNGSGDTVVLLFSCGRQPVQESVAQIKKAIKLDYKQLQFNFNL